MEEFLSTEEFLGYCSVFILGIEEVKQAKRRFSRLMLVWNDSECFVLPSGEKHGIWRRKRMGRTAEWKMYVDGKEHGRHEKYDDIGRMLLKETFENGQLEGESFSYDYRARLVTVTTFSNGTKQGCERTISLFG